MPRHLCLLALLLAAPGCEERHAPAPIPTGSAAPTTAFRYDPEWEGAAAPLPRRVVIETSAGVIHCELDPQANAGALRRLAALARGELRYRGREGWRKQRAYDGATFDRASAGLFVATRPVGASARPRQPHAKAPPAHETPGLLSFGSEGELALTAAPAPELDATMTPIGRCTPVDGIDALSRTPARFGRPIDPPRIERLVVHP